MSDETGVPYAVPLSIARMGDKIYFHCAYEGEKVEVLKYNSKVCVVCVGRVEPATDKFTTAYESAIIRGTAMQVDDITEKVNALRAICQRYTPLNMAAFDRAIEKSLTRTAVWSITIEDRKSVV